MTRKEDERLLGQVQQKLISQGIRPPCKVTAEVKDGIVTLSGTVQHDYQKRAAARVCQAMPAVKRVINNIQTPGFKNVWSSRKEWEYKPNAGESKPAGPGAPRTGG